MRKPVIVLGTGAGFLALALTLGGGLGPVGRLLAQNKSDQSKTDQTKTDQTKAESAAPTAAAPKKPSADAQKKIDAALKAIADAQDSLAKEGLYDPAIEPTSAFAVTTGGSSAAKELEQGQPVDPETYAGLYAGFIRPDLKSKLTTNEQGELLYNGKLVQIYPISKLKVLYQERADAFRRVTSAAGTTTPASTPPAKKEEPKTAAPPAKKEETKPAAPKKEESKSAAPKKEESKQAAPKKEESKQATPKKEESKDSTKKSG